MLEKIGGVGGCVNHTEFYSDLLGYLFNCFFFFK